MFNSRKVLLVTSTNQKLKKSKSYKSVNIGVEKKISFFK